MTNTLSRRTEFSQFEFDGWQNINASYERHWGAITTAFVPCLFRACGKARGLRALDVASGPGHGVNYADSLGMPATGVDFSPLMIAQAQMNFPHLQFITADVVDLPFADQSFDVVVCNFGVQHFDDLDRAFSEIARVMAPGGRLSFSCWSGDDVNAGGWILDRAMRACDAAEYQVPEGPGYHVFSQVLATCQLLKRNGFELHQSNQREVRRIWRLNDPDQLFRAECSATVRSGARLRAQTPALKEKIRIFMMKDIKENYANEDGHCELEMSAQIFEASKIQ
jgi:SAM-dependent methyltransferase